MKRNQNVPGDGAVPDFGPMLRRDRLLKAARALNHDLLLLTAPAGYGKSVLAGQIAGELFDSTVWVSLSGASTSPLALLELIARRLGAQLPDGGAATVVASSRNEAYLLESIGAVSRQIENPRLCVVVDDVSLDDSLEVLLEASRALRQRSPRRALLVATSRSHGSPPGSAKCCVLDSQDLRLSEDESLALVESVAARCLGQEVVEAVVDVSGGHAALLTVLARHAISGGQDRSDGVIRPCGDIRGHLLEIAHAQVSERGRRILEVIALFGSGTADDVASVVDGATAEDLHELAECLPLLRVGAPRRSGPIEFTMHDLARDAFASQPGCDRLRRSVVARLLSQGECERAARLLAEADIPDDMVESLEMHGETLIERGLVLSVADALGRLSGTANSRPRITLLNARVAAEKGDLDEAHRKALAARRLAQDDRNGGVVVEALSLAARISLSLGRYDQTAALLGEMFDLGVDSLEPGSRSFLYACAAALSAFAGDAESARRYLPEASACLAETKQTPEATARVTNMMGVVHVVGFGDNSEASRMLHEALRLKPLSPSVSELLLGNAAGACMERGRISRALQYFEQLERHCETYGFADSLPAYQAVKAGCLAAIGDLQPAAELSASSVEGCAELGDDYCTVQNLFYRSVILNSIGDHDTALLEAERALELAAHVGAPLHECYAAIQVRAALLGLGDTVAASHVSGSRGWAVSHEAAHLALLADLILAEIDRVEGRSSDAVARVREHREYLLSESANWLTAMYVRAFPGLLGVVAAAAGAERVPAHMLKMLLAETLTAAMPLARESMTPESWKVLAKRLGHSAKPAETRAGAVRTGPPECRVRFFGGLEVTTPDGPIPDRAWRKRKARALFAMLVAARGKDVPRDVLLEQLWPGMDEARARNNFYVNWSAMKSAIAPTVPKGVSCPYVETFAGVCRVVPGAVESDLDVFDEALLQARKAEQAGDPGPALEAYERIAELYRGELMSGDLYDDWCAPLRDRYRHEFGDAMLRAGRLHAEQGDMPRALQTARLALAHDSLREDLYQAALEYQIGCGQRSAAIETYMSCRSRLAEDLGLDPSLETRRLYDRILAMEDGPT